jgi:hypothetical protein
MEAVVTRPRLTAALLSGALLASLVACGAKDDSGGLPSTGTSTTTSSAQTPTASAPSPTPTAVPTQVLGKYRDLSLDLRRPATIDAKAEPGVGQFQRLHQLFAAMLAGGSTPPELSKIAGSGTVKILNDLMKPQRKAKERSGGSLTVRVTKARSSGNLTVVDGCFDQTRLQTIRANGSRYVDATVKRNPTMTVRTTLSDTAGGWRVDDYVLKGGKC